ncbi:MAG: glycosyltransferase [Planctomycetota bacterium]
MISFVIPTRDRPAELAETLDRLSHLCARTLDHAGGAEVLIVDNHSTEPVKTPSELTNGIPVQTHRLDTNRGAAARNVAAEQARGDWLVMLDDDSAPDDADFVHELLAAPDDLAAIGARILLPNGTLDRGGLPEVIVGCGAAIRTEAFQAAGGYDEAFGYYVEEYDLAAKLIAAGHRIEHISRFRVTHRKSPHGRDLGRIVARLTRNTVWLAVRYAPAGHADDYLDRELPRIRAIAHREGVAASFKTGFGEGRAAITEQQRRPLTFKQWDRFIGAAAAREHLTARAFAHDWRSACLAARGKHDWVIENVLDELDMDIVEPSDADVTIAGTLAPGPMLDAAPAHPAWRIRDTLVDTTSSAQGADHSQAA